MTKNIDLKVKWWEYDKENTQSANMKDNDHAHLHYTKYER